MPPTPSLPSGYCSAFGPDGSRLRGARRRLFLYTYGIIVFTFLLRAPCQAIDQIGHPKKILGPEAASIACGALEGVHGCHARPAKGNMLQPLRSVQKVDPVLTPSLLLRYQLKLTSEERMKGVRHPHKGPLARHIGCSRLLSPTRSKRPSGFRSRPGFCPCSRASRTSRWIS
jgi:hypothetical protein